VGVVRSLGFFIAIDVAFKILVGLAFFEIMGAHAGPLRAELLELSSTIIAVTWPLWLATLWVLLRPSQQWKQAQLARSVGAALVHRTHVSFMHLPLRVAVVWAGHWVLTYFAVFVIGSYDFGAPQLLFLATLVCGPAILGHALTTWRTMAPWRDVHEHADRMRLNLRRTRSTIRRQISFYAICISIAPAGFMASIGIVVGGGTASATLYYGIGLGVLGVAVFALLVAFLVAHALTRPLLEIDSAIQRIGTTDGPKEFVRIPRLHGNEIGQLAEHTNELLARLDQMARHRASVDRDIAIAQQIQTSILPRRWEVDGLELSASMITATQVGGDYFDILPRTGGGWLGIGDVSGHGVNAGLIMLMLQSVTATMVSANPEASTRDLVVAINRVLAENIRKRLRGNDFITFTLLRYDTDGRLRFAGAHEDLVIWRAKSQRCERVPTPGPWVGVMRDIDHVTIESELVLEPEDVLVLYTDGVIEARDSGGRLFGIERLCATVESSAKERPDVIVDNVVQAVRKWGRVQEDDISVVVARHVGLN
jgi:serine phosphatase RsbU (regulator of sigma subunit)